MQNLYLTDFLTKNENLTEKQIIQTKETVHRSVLPICHGLPCHMEIWNGLFRTPDGFRHL